MDQNFVMTIASDSVKIIFMMSGPLILTGLAVGLLVSIIQTTTSIQEQSLSYIPKMIAILVSLVIFGNWMMSHIITFTLNLFDKIPGMIMFNG